MNNITGSETILILGGDGYLGWSLGLAFANRTDKLVVLADSMIKRQWEKQAGAKLLVPLDKPKARVAEYRRRFGKSNLMFEKLDLMDQPAVSRIIKKYNPKVIINAAQQPSAPFSMSNPSNAALTFSNNINGHLNTLWAIAQINPGIKYIKLGSAGCYMDTDTTYLPLGKLDLKFEHQGKTYKVLQSFLPMQATDFYHQSKISDFLIDDLCARLWNLKVITVQQATIFGATIPENHDPEHVKLSARFNYDAVFSTVLNRFVCQAAIGHPITVYGDGQQKTGVISLTDTIENFFDLAELDVAAGEHTVVHNFTHRLSIEQIARKIAAAVPGTEIQYIQNPRQEPAGQLSRKVEVHEAIKPRHARKEARLEAELARLVEFTQRHKDNIDTAIIMPKVAWKLERTETADGTPLAGALSPQPARRHFGQRAYVFNERIDTKR